MTNTEKRIAAQAVHSRAREMRGTFLNTVACIEKRIANLLTDYFCRDCPKKKKLFFDQIVSKSFFGLRVKRDILARILKEDYPRYWMENQEHLNRAFCEVADFRNRLAHCVVDVSDEALARPIGEGVAFVDRDDCTPITDRDFNDFEVKANMILGCLNDIERLLPYKEIPIPKP
jgi:hypothetical protein